MEACNVCAQIDLGLSNRENARRIGVDESSIRRHKAHMSEQKDSFFDIPNEIITSRGRTVRLQDGSYEKVTYNPNRRAMLEALSYDDLERAIEGFVPHPPRPRRATGTTRVLCVSDLQIGKAHEVLGGTPELIQRVMASFHSFVTQCTLLPTDEIVIADLGDIIEGFGNTKSQAQTNDTDLTTQIRTARRLLIEIIKMCVNLAPKITYVSVPSNHCQVRAEGSKDLASTTDNDWGLEISHQIEDALGDRPGFEHVEFVRPARIQEAVTIQTGGTTVGFVHGHQARSPEKIGEWWKGQSHGRRSNLHNADLLIHGHYHSLRVTQSGDARWVFGTPTSDGGSTWFTNTTGEQSVTGMLTFTLTNGKWSDLEII